MTREEIEKLILRRAYEGAFLEGVEDTFNLHKFAEENGINNDEAWKAYQELEDYGRIEAYACGGFIRSTPAGLLYAESNKVVDERIVLEQNRIRTKLLVSLAAILDLSPHGTIVDWEYWIGEAGVSQQDFQNNDEILRYLGLVNRPSVREHDLSPAGWEKVRDYRRRVRRAEDFERLEKLEGVTEQQRGHKLEDLLADSAEWEGWEVTRRVRAQGQENDIIMHVGLNYFLNSCKWEIHPIQSVEVDILFSRIHSRAQTNGGILFSMSGFTDNCIEEIRLKIGTARIIAFGPADIKLIMSNETTMTSLLDEKIDQLMNHRAVLVDGIIRRQ